ncbi:MAG: tRNA glutamyl-Q synthetase [Flammeovirgaceae bacterium]|nr:tRNA glutamyl-Q synthetase [Flammeovirgaceae bacterium]
MKEKIIKNVKTRIAPTPSGLLHLGNIFSFVLTWVLAKKEGGSVHLRIDDLDEVRKRKIYLEDIFQTLKWLNLEWDFGPSGVEDFEKNYSQKYRLELYKKSVKKLLGSNAGIFSCDCSRSEVKKNSPDGLYTGACRNTEFQRKDGFAFRIKTENPTLINFQDELLGRVELDIYQHIRDFVIKRKDGNPAYQVASLVDDINDGINLIVRGKDLLPSTAAQLFLAQKLNENQFIENRFFHHPLILENPGDKLSKSHQSLSINYLRESNVSSAKVFETIGEWMNIKAKKIDSLNSLLEEFQLTELPKNAIYFRNSVLGNTY